MIQKQSEDPHVEVAAAKALQIIADILSKLPKADVFDYGGHLLHIGEYEVCGTCTSPIAEAQQAHTALLSAAAQVQEPVVKEHLELAAQLFQLESEAAIIRAEFHNGFGTEKIVNALLGYIYDRGIADDYAHSHKGGN